MKNTRRLLPIMGCLQLTSMLCCGQLLAADPHRWCAVEGGGGTNCGFVSVEQCRTSISGLGGFASQSRSLRPTCPRQQERQHLKQTDKLMDA